MYTYLGSLISDISDISVVVLKIPSILIVHPDLGCLISDNSVLRVEPYWLCMLILGFHFNYFAHFVRTCLFIINLSFASCWEIRIIMFICHVETYICTGFWEREGS